MQYCDEGVGTEFAADFNTVPNRTVEYMNNHAWFGCPLGVHPNIIGRTMTQVHEQRAHGSELRYRKVCVQDSYVLTTRVIYKDHSYPGLCGFVNTIAFSRISKDTSVKAPA